MRIVAGEWRGRRLAIPSGAVRPTADRVREAWMSIVYGLLPGATVVDLCAGSGALGLEALSRGAHHATLVESSERVLRTLRENVAHLGAESRATIVRADAVTFVRKLDAGAFDVAFADPPYATGIAGEIVERWQEVPFAAVLGIEHSARVTLPGAGDTRRYGDSAVTFYRVQDSHST
jgi:16S rRNA (guanine966-N2)-methyltransferase